MSKCTHEKVCVECVREEIKKKEAELDELKNKLPYNPYGTSAIGGTYIIDKLPYIPPLSPWFKDPNVVWCVESSEKKMNSTL